MTWEELHPGKLMRYEFGVLRIDAVDGDELSFSTIQRGAWAYCGTETRSHVEPTWLLTGLWNPAEQPATSAQQEFMARNRLVLTAHLLAASRP